jgi:hypothetical protein
VNVELSELVSLEVGVFNLLGCDVLSLLKLEDVLLSIDDAHGFCLRVESSDIAGFQPAVFGQGLLSLDLIVIVAQEDSRPTRPKLSSGICLALFIFIGGEIAHLGNIDKLNLETSLYSSISTRGPPTCLTSGSRAVVILIAPVDSV